MKIAEKSFFFYLGLLFMSLSAILVGSTYLFLIKGLNPAMKAMAIGCFLLSMLQKERTRRNLLQTAAVVAVAFLVALVADNTMFIVYILALAAGIKEDSERIIRFFFVINSLQVVAVLLLCLFGVLENEEFVHSGIEILAYSLGFTYYTALAYIVLFLSVMYFYIKKNKNQILMYSICVLVCNYLVYKVTTTRLTMVLAVAWIVLVWVYKKLHLMKFRRMNLWIATVMFPGMMALSVLLPFIYTKSSFLTRLNAALNARLYFSREGFARYSVRLFGNHIITNSGGLDEQWRNTYFYIDSGYVYLLLGYGLIIAVLTITAYTALSRYAVKTQQVNLFLWCMIICIFSFVNNPILDLGINPLLFVGAAEIGCYRKRRLARQGNGYNPHLTESIM